MNALTLSLLAAIVLASTICSCANPDSSNALESRSRDKRSIYLNSEAPILIAAYITLPISVAFPALKGRSARSSSSSAANGTSSVPYSYDDPLYAAQLHKIDLYMDYLGIEDDVCRQRFLCEISADPAVFDPVYSIFKKQLSTDFEVKPNYFNRFFRYRSAMIEGRRSSLNQSANTCVQLYGSCESNTPEMINMYVLKIMQFMTRKLRVQFGDN